MVKFAKQVAVNEKVLTQEERNILSVAYKNVVGLKRNSRRLLSSLQQAESQKGGEANVARIEKYKQQVESELKEPCNDVIGLLD